MTWWSSSIREYLKLIFSSYVTILLICTTSRVNKADLVGQYLLSNSNVDGKNTAQNRVLSFVFFSTNARVIVAVLDEPSSGLLF